MKSNYYFSLLMIYSWWIEIAFLILILLIKSILRTEYIFFDKGQSAFTCSVFPPAILYVHLCREHFVNNDINLHCILISRLVTMNFQSYVSYIYHYTFHRCISLTTFVALSKLPVFQCLHLIGCPFLCP